jgi:hypothetical protein
MKSIAIFSAVSWLLLGTSVGDGITVVQYGALGILGFVVVWFCVRGFPAIIEAQKGGIEALKASIDALATEIRVLKERIDRK